MNGVIDVEDEKARAANQFGGNVLLGDLIWVRLNGHSWWPAQVTDESTVSRNHIPGNRSKGEALVRLYGSYEYLYVDPMKFHSEFEKVLEQNNGSYSDIFRKSLEQDRPNSKPGRGKGKGSKSKENASLVASKDKILKKKDQGLEASNSKTRALNVDALEIEGKKEHSVMKNPIGNISKTGMKKRKTPLQDISTLKAGVKNAKLVIKGTPTSKATGVQKKRTPNSPSLEILPLGTSEEPSARRTKVMQSLGLMAPSGSPFQRTRRIIQLS